MKVKLTIPTDLSEITLGQYQKYVQDSKGLEGDALDQLTVSVFCNLPEYSVNFIKLSDVRDISEHINLLFSIEQPLTPIFKIKDMELGFIPSLEDISFGEYVDLDKHINNWDSMHNAMAVIYRPITTRVKDQYELTPYTGTEEFCDLMRHIPLNIVLGSMVFFYALGNELLKATLRYSVEETEKVIIQNSDNLTSDGDGITAYMHLLKETLESLTKPLEYVQQQHLLSLPTNRKDSE